MLTQYDAIAKAISILFSPYAEVIVHNLKTGRIAAIYNNFSKRKIGDPSLIEETEHLTTLPDVFPVYAKTNWDGRKLKSISVTLRDTKGAPIGLLCINIDISRFEQLQRFLKEWLSEFPTEDQPEILFKDDWREKINQFVADYTHRFGLTTVMLSKEQKKEIVQALQQKGAFKTKNAAMHIAAILGISRATIYNYLR